MKEIYQDYFTGSQGHNTVMVDGKSQMLKGNRFIWYFWSQANEASWTETDNAYIFKGSISAFRFINPNCTHSRTIEIAKNDLKWVVEDEISNTNGLTKSQIWHLDEYNWGISAVSDDSKTINEQKGTSYNSIGYGQKLNGKASIFKFLNTIKTTLVYKENN